MTSIKRGIRNIQLRSKANNLLGNNEFWIWNSKFVLNSQKFVKSCFVVENLYCIYIHTYIHMYIYRYTYTLWFQFAKFANQIFRKPDVCPVSEAKFRKPVLAGLRSNNEMNLFGFRRCYRSKKKLLIITILLHLNNICLREIYITLLEKLLTEL